MNYKIASANNIEEYRLSRSLIMYLQKCTPEQLKDIHAEFGVTEDSLKHDAAYIMEWLEKQPHLPNIEDEEFIINLLLRCKTSVERAKKQLDDSYTGQAILAKIFPRRNTDTKLKLFKDILMDFGFFTPMSKLTPEAHRIFILSFRDDITKVPSSDDLLQALLLFYSAIWKLDQHKSVIIIYDLKNISMAMLSTFIILIPKLIEIAYKTMRLRFFKFYLLNMSTRYESLLNLFKAIMPPKEVAKIQFWKRKSEDLAEVLPKDVLPVEYGGTEKSMKECAALWYEEMETLKDWLTSEEEVIADLEKRSKINRINDHIGGAYGIDGTFRKLAVD